MHSCDFSLGKTLTKPASLFLLTVSLYNENCIHERNNDDDDDDVYIFINILLSYIQEIAVQLQMTLILRSS